MESLDPEHISYPCSACRHEIADGELAIQCEGYCSAWFHCFCALGFKLTAAQLF